MLCVIGEEDVGLFVCDDVDVIAVVDVVVANQENEIYFWDLQFLSLMSFKKMHSIYVLVLVVGTVVVFVGT